MPTQEMPAADNKPMSPFAAAIILFNRLVGRALTQTEARSLEAVLENRPQDGVSGSAAAPLPHGGQPWQISAEGLVFIKRFEGCARKRRDGRFDAYPDPGTGGDPWTIGWGATGTGIRKGTIWTQDECDARLAADVARHAADVARAIGKAPTTQAQFDALVSFHYNTGAIGRATLTRLHVAGDHAGAAREFSRWVRAGGRVMAGLVRRRDAEVSLYCRK
jgi:lysozyme